MKESTVAEILCQHLCDCIEHDSAQVDINTQDYRKPVTPTENSNSTWRPSEDEDGSCFCVKRHGTTSNFGSSAALPLCCPWNAWINLLLPCYTYLASARGISSAAASYDSSWWDQPIPQLQLCSAMAMNYQSLMTQKQVCPHWSEWHNIISSNDFVLSRSKSNFSSSNSLAI